MTTRWSVVVSAQRKDAPEATQALEQLCRACWYPLYAHLRQAGHSPADAEDLTQAFFARLLLKADLTAQHTNGLNALMHAVEKRDRVIIAMLPRFFEIAYTPDRAHRRETLAALPGLDRALLKGTT